MSEDPTTGIPEFEDTKSLTEWVIDTSAATGIDAHTLWLIVKSTAEGEKAKEDLTEADIDTDRLMEEVAEAQSSDGEYEPPSEPAVTSEESPDFDADPGPDPEPEFDWGDPGDDEVDVFGQWDEGGDGEFDVSVDEGAEAFGTDQPEGDVVTQQEYDQFKHEVQGLVQNLIEFLISYDMLSEEEPKQREEILQEFEMLTRNFEEDVSEFFSHLDSLLDGTEPAEADGAAANTESNAGRTDDQQMADIMDQLGSSVSDMQDISTEETEEEAEPDQQLQQDLASLTEKLEESQYQADDDIRQTLGRLNRILDEVGDFPGQQQSQPQRETQPREQRETQPRERSQARAEEPFGRPKSEAEASFEEYETGYHERYEDTRGSKETPAATAAAFTTSERHRPEGPPREDRRRDTRQPEQPMRQTSMLGLAPIDLAWLGAGITYGGLDMFSTSLVLQGGGTELNPLFDLLGGNIGGFVLWKTFVLFLLFVFFYPDDPEQPESMQWWVPLIVSLAGIILTVSNLLVLIGLNPLGAILP